LKLWIVLARAQRAIQQHAEADVARHGLTLAEFAVLEALYHRGELLLGELQKKVLVSSGGMTWLVNRLGERGLVERRACDQDRRARYAALTPAGKRLMKRIFPAHGERIDQSMRALSTAERVQAAELLKKLGLDAAAMLEEVEQEEPS
jgi:MarR family 2-MHQ and catechol resistance regulon transcriptional repressor